MTDETKDEDKKARSYDEAVARFRLSLDRFDEAMARFMAYYCIDSKDLERLRSGSYLERQTVKINLFARPQFGLEERTNNYEARVA